MTRWALVRAGPYRLFFPLGILYGIIGVGHWALWSVGWISESRAFFHAALQVQGFLASFAAGFLLTALPRFSGTFEATTFEVAWALAAALSFGAFSWVGRWAAAEASFLALIAALVSFAARRLPRRTKNPPVSFLLVFLGLLQAVLGAAFMLAGRFGRESLYFMEAGRQMLQVGFLLSLVLGIGGYLAPFLTGHAGDPRADPGAGALRDSSPAGLFLHTAVGTVILGSFFAEPVFPRPAAGLRAGGALIHLILFARIYRPVRKKTPTAWFFWIACWMVPAGLVTAAARPSLRIAGLHLTFIGGFSLLIFSFGLLVILSHGGQAHLLNSRLIPLRIVGAAVLLAAALRLIADLDAWRYRTWIHLASGVWVLAAGLWLVYVFPKLWTVPAFDEEGRPVPSYRAGRS